MANIAVRSPYFITDSETGAVSSKVEVTIDSTLRYTIIKNTGENLRLDISELVRDYVQPTYIGLIDVTKLGTVSVDIAISFWDTINATGTQVGTTNNLPTHTAYDGYAYFSDGNTFDIPEGVLLSGTTIYAPENTTGSFYVMGAGGNLGIQVYGATTESAGGITIKRQPCSKYDPVKCVFINRFGVHQELYFFAKKTDSFNTTGQKYSSNIVQNNGTYSTSAHQFVDFNKNGKISYNLSTGYIGQEANPYIQELMLSEQVWLVIDSNVVPVNINTQSVQYKTSLNDKLVAYTMDFEQSNDVISTIK